MRPFIAIIYAIIIVFIASLLTSISQTLENLVPTTVLTTSFYHNSVSITRALFSNTVLKNETSAQLQQVDNTTAPTETLPKKILHLSIIGLKSNLLEKNKIYNLKVIRYRCLDRDRATDHIWEYVLNHLNLLLVPNFNKKLSY
jgi:hypothetical protein